MRQHRGRSLRSVTARSVLKLRLYGAIEICLLLLLFFKFIFYTPGSKDPRGSKLQKLKSKCRMVRGPAGQLAKCRAEAQS